jgi:1A family penicillin-binding protein
LTTTMRLLRWLGGLMALLLALSGVLAVAAAVLFFVTVRELPRIPEPLRRIIETPPTEIFAANGEPILQIGGREYVPLEQISLPLVQAILATEDHLFWEHHGVNKLRLLKALSLLLLSEGRPQGASTITQQLAKNLFFSFEQTYARKFRELMVALQIESQFSKQEILEAYLNQIYFGPHSQGVAAAASTLFGKSAAQLNLSEAALLAGLPKSPTRYNPLRYPERAKDRQKVVLNRMATAGFISDMEAGEAFNRPLNFSERRSSGRSGGYFVDWVLKSLEEKYGPQVVYHGGLKVTTTMDPQLQYWAEQAVQDGLGDVEKMMGERALGRTGERLQGALAAVQVNSGAVKALVGGRDYTETEFNRAVESNRQPGSGFKPFLYYTALERLGLTPASVVIDQPVVVPVAGAPDWMPRNFERDYVGPVILKKAFTGSVNTVAAQLVVQTGPRAVIDTARQCGIISPLASVYSVALGTSGVSPLEMASAFGTFAGNGVRFVPFGVWRVEDAYGQVLEEHIVSGSRQLDPQLAYQIVDMMKGTIEYGTGRTVRKLGFNKPAAGKTGTTNAYQDAWFTGFTPTLSTSVWVGYDRKNELRDANRAGITGGRGAVPIWTRFMLKATEGDPPKAFNLPAGMREIVCDPTSGRQLREDDPDGIKVIVRESESYHLFRETNLTP